MHKMLKALIAGLAASALIAASVIVHHKNQSMITLNNHLEGWFSSESAELAANTKKYITWADQHLPANISGRPKAVVVPHAGHKFSGIAAASVYAALKKNAYKKVVVLAPSHSGQFVGLASPEFDAYKVPSGTLYLDTKTAKALSRSPLITINIDEFEREHSLEVQLPFLVEALGSTPILPLLVGRLEGQDQVQELAKTLSGVINDQDLLLVTSDFTHYGPSYDYSPFPDKHSQRAKVFDSQAIEAIMTGQAKDFGSFVRSKNRTICGKNALRLMLELFNTSPHLKGLSSRLTCYYSSLNSMAWDNFWPKNTSDIIQVPSAGRQDSFVTYAGLVFYKPDGTHIPLEKTFSGFEKALLKLMANFSVHEGVYAQDPADLRHLCIGSGAHEKVGVFITLKKNNQLRGCIGRTITDDPLYKTISEVAYLSAFQDNRFPPVKSKELPDIEVKLSILSKPRPVDSYKHIELGRQGIVLEKTVNGRPHSALYLPEVATEQGWSLETTLSELAEKAGLAKDAWRQNCHFKVFETLSI